MRFAVLALLLAVAPGAARGGQYFQDFTSLSVGATNVGDGSQLFSDQGSNVCGVVDSTLKELQLTDASVGNTHSAYLLPDLDTNKVFAFSAKWNAMISGPFSNGADGMSFTFGQVRSLNLASGFAQEDGFGTGITFSIRTFYDNAPGFYIRVNGSAVATQAYLSASQWGTNSVLRHFFEVDWNSAAGISVKMNGTNIFTNVRTPGFRAQPGDSFVFAARSGGLSETVRVDNIVVMTGGNLVQVPMESPFYKSEEFVGPGQTADKAFDGTNLTKWLALNSTGYVGATCSSNARAIRAYVTMVAEDIPNRDPKHWTIDGSNNSGTNWSTVATRSGVFSTNRNEQRAWLTTNSSPFSVFRMNILTNSGDPSIQLAELKLYEFQTFASYVENTNSALPTCGAFAEWVDYDNDGWLDIFAGGETEFLGSNSELWRNNGDGTFTVNTNGFLGGLNWGLGAWGDINNDGYLDFVYGGGVNYNPAFTAVFLNDGDGTFTQVYDPALISSTRGEMVAADYDNDGYVDMYINGAAPMILHNNGNGTFSQDTRSSFEFSFDVAVAAADYNKDGYVDILQSGRTNTGFNPAAFGARLYTNRGDGTFSVDTNTVLLGLHDGDATWTDYDNDGTPDFSYCGATNGSGLQAQLWRGNGAGLFSQNTSNALGAVVNGETTWGDGDGDGRSDYLLSSSAGLGVFFNRGNGTFAQDPGVPSFSLDNGGNDWGDYDRDGDLDIYANGKPNTIFGGPYVSRLLRNALDISNAPPSAPTALGTTNASGLRVTLTWSAPADDTTPAAALSYDVRIGTSSGGRQIASPPADSTTGIRRLSRHGAVRGQAKATFYLPLGTYYASVQAIDNGLAGSPFSTEMVFTVSSGGIAPTATTAAATAVDAATETLKGQVDPNGLPTAMWFEWGTTTNYGNVLAVGTANFVNVTAVSSNLSGLSAATLYNYRVMASNSQGVATGANVSFTTLGGVPTISTLDVAETGPTNVTLVGQANPNYVTTFVWFVWGATTNFGNTTAEQDIGNGSSTVTVSNRISNLVSAATYYYRAFASNVFGVATGSVIQFMTSDTNVIIDATTPGTPIVGSSGNSPGAQLPPKGIDNIAATKYLNFDKLDTGFDVAVYDTSKIVRALTLISAEDSPERDPASYTLWGSPDGTNFTLIASNAVPAFAGRNVIQYLPITNSSAYPVYRVRFPNIANEGSANSMQIAEVELLTVPEITSAADAVGGIFFGLLMSSASTLVDRGLGSASKFLITSNAGPETVNIIPAAGRSVLKAFEVIGADDDATYPERHSTNLVVYGSDNGFTWFALGSFTSTPPTVSQRIEEYQLFGNTTPYYRYRIEFGQQPSGITWQLGEVRLFGDVLAPMDSWRYDVFGTTNDLGIAGDAADPDGDRNANLIEYATGNLPYTSNSTSFINLLLTNNGTLLFDRYTNAVDATIYVEGAVSVSNGATWQGIATNRNGSWGGATNVTEGGGNPAAVMVTDTQAGTNRFHRLRVTHP